MFVVVLPRRKKVKLIVDAYILFDDIVMGFSTECLESCISPIPQGYINLQESLVSSTSGFNINRDIFHIFILQRFQEIETSMGLHQVWGNDAILNFKILFTLDLFVGG